MNIRTLFESELHQRGFPFSIDAESGRHAIEIGGGRMLISIENLQRDVAADGDTGRVSRFVDALLASAGAAGCELSAERLYWSLEPNNYEQRADILEVVSDHVDRVLVHLSVDPPVITWVTHAMLDSLGLSESAAGEKAFANLGCALRNATIDFQDIDGVRLGFITTSLPFKASLLLAPNLREVAEDLLGWPLMAVAPDRDFLYLWAARHTDFVQRVGNVVVREYSQASYPISTEVYEITDQDIQSVGSFQSEASRAAD